MQSNRAVGKTKKKNVEKTWKKLIQFLFLLWSNLANIYNISSGNSFGCQKLKPTNCTEISALVSYIKKHNFGGNNCVNIFSPDWDSTDQCLNWTEALECIGEGVSAFGASRVGAHGICAKSFIWQCLFCYQPYLRSVVEYLTHPKRKTPRKGSQRLGNHRFSKLSAPFLKVKLVATSI